MRFFFLLMFAAILSLSPAAHAEGPMKIVTSIKPFQSLVMQVVGDHGDVDLLISGQASPHDYRLKPSDAQKLQVADAVFWGGPVLESFLGKTVLSLVTEGRAFDLTTSNGLEKLPNRTIGGHHHGHAHGHEQGQGHGHGHGHGQGHGQGHGHMENYDHDARHMEDPDHVIDHHGLDPHVWLDPHNAKVMMTAIADHLGALVPEKKDVFIKNAESASATMDQLEKDIAEMLRPYQSVPFMVYHDAFQYFENRFGLTFAGAVTMNPAVQAGAGHVSGLSEKIASGGVSCIFYEPQFTKREIQKLQGQNRLIQTEIDPLGSTIDSAPDHYSKMMRAIASSFESCLGSAS